jgi:hypothetical protein
MTSNAFLTCDAVLQEANRQHGDQTPSAPAHVTISWAWSAALGLCTSS